MPIDILKASTSREIEEAFATIVRERVETLFICADWYFELRRVQLLTLATRHGIATSYSNRTFPEAGGLMSYGTDALDVYRQVGAYTGQILKGAKPADLPVVQPTRFEFVINMLTAKALGLTIPETLLATADQVIRQMRASHDAKTFGRRQPQWVTSRSAEQSAAVLMHGRCTPVSGPGAWVRVPVA